MPLGEGDGHLPRRWFRRIFLIGLSLGLMSSALSRRSNKEHTCAKYTHETCPCGDSGHFLLYVKLCPLKNLYTGETICEPCHGRYHQEKLCRMFGNCQRCTSGYKKCFSCPPGTSGDFCTEVIQKPDDSEPYFPNSILMAEQENDADVDLDAFSKDEPLPRKYHGRMKRQLDDRRVCVYSDCPQTLHLHCTYYPDKIVCTAKCIHGFTFPDGVEMKFTCKYSENKWEPNDVEECKPHIRCALKLVSPGDLKCTDRMTLSGTICSISCDAAKGKKAVAKRDYFCNLKGEWAPDIPFCVEFNTDVSTVRPP